MRNTVVDRSRNRDTRVVGEIIGSTAESAFSQRSPSTAVSNRGNAAAEVDGDIVPVSRNTVNALGRAGVNLAVVGSGDLTRIGGGDEIVVGLATEASCGAGVDFASGDNLGDADTSVVAQIVSSVAVLASSVGEVDTAVGNGKGEASVVGKIGGAAAFQTNTGGRITNAVSND